MNNMTASLPLDVISFMVPVLPHPLLLPNQVVAEILLQPPYLRSERMTDRILARQFIWRGYQIPVAPYELLLNDASIKEDNKGRSHVMILRGIFDHYPPYFALLIHQLPKLVWVTQQDLSDGAEGILESTESLLVKFKDEVVAIPNLSYIENKIISGRVERN